MCVCMCVVCKEYIMLFLRFLIHFDDCVNHSVLTFAADIPPYRNDCYYYYYIMG